MKRLRQRAITRHNLWVPQPSEQDGSIDWLCWPRFNSPGLPRSLGQIHLRGPNRTGRQGCAATAPDPGHLESEMFGAGDVESVGRNKYHLIVFQTERLLDQRIAIRVRFEFPRAVNAEGRVEKSIKTGIPDQSRQHRRTAV